jgi:hypothetical protein
VKATATAAGLCVLTGVHCTLCVLRCFRHGLWCTPPCQMRGSSQWMCRRCVQQPLPLQDGCVCVCVCVWGKGGQ